MLRTSSLAGGGPSIAQAVFLEDTQPIDVTIYGRRYLQSGYVETDTTTFDTSIFTDKSFLAISENSTGLASTAVRDMLYVNNTYFITDNNRIASSPDTVTWTDVTPTLASPYTLCYGDGLYLFAGGGSSDIFTSIDGITWDNKTNPNSGSNTFASIYGDGLYLLGGSTGDVFVSSDTDSWTTRDNQFTTGNVRGLEYAINLYVCVGDDGQLSTSPNATTWTLRTSQFGVSDIFAVKYLNGLFVAVGADGKVSYSSDGLAWTAGAVSTAGSLLDVAYVSDRYIVVGSLGTQSSSDLMLWEDEDIGVAAPKGIVNNGSFVVTSALSDSVFTSTYNNYAGSTVAYAENNENQYIRIT